MKIVLLIDNLGSGGAQRQMLTLALGLVKECEVVLVTYQDHNHMNHMISDSGIRRIEIKAVNNLFRLLSIMYSIRKESPDVIISFLDTPNKIAGMYKICVPSIVWIPSERNVVQAPTMREILWRRIFYRNAKFVVSNTQTQKKWLLEILQQSQAKHLTIYNGISDKLFQSENTRGSDFLCLGRLSYQKNPELLIKALDHIKDVLPRHVNFKWYGEEDPGCFGLRDELNLIAKQKNLPISFNKPVVDVVGLMKNFRFFVMTSRFEGTPNALIEAMANRLYPICTRVADIPEIVDNRSIHGHLFDSENYVALSESIMSVLAMNDYDIDKKTSVNMHSVKMMFSEARMVKEFWGAINA